MSTTKTREFGPFVLKRLLGHGGIGTVYLAQQDDAGEEIAVKVLPKSAAANGQYAKQFLTEARLAKHLDHPNIIHILGYGRQEGRYYLAMEYVDGESCKARISKAGRLGWREAVEITIQAAEGLAAAAAKGIIHRDIKPENLLIDKAGRVRISDLGLAKEMGKIEPLPSDTSLGTPDYMSPEQVNNSETVDFRSDIYALGASLFHMVCGKAPYTGRSAYEVMVKHVSANLPSPRKYAPDLPKQVCDVMRKMMARDPDDRYQSYDGLIVDLRALLAGESVAAQEFEDESMLGSNGVANGHAHRSARLVWVAVGLPLVLGVGGLLYLFVLR